MVTVVGLFLVKLGLVSASILKNIDTFKLNGWRPAHNNLHVAAIHYEPFVFNSGKFPRGIEYKLLETISEKERLNFSIQFQDHFRSFHFNQVLYG